MKTAIFVDGSFFLKRLKYLYRNKPRFNINDPETIVNELERICYNHLNEKKRTDSIKELYKREHVLYRIFFYDCKPLTKKAHKPISKKAIDFSKTPQAIMRTQIHELLKKKRKTALRLGALQDFSQWIMKPNVLKDILNKKRELKDLTDDDFEYEVRQKSVDMKIGIDIASVAYKKQVERIILIAGDADFVPAAKLARREGIDFILDPMWLNIRPDLFEHIDGLASKAYHDPKSR